MCDTCNPEYAAAVRRYGAGTANLVALNVGQRLSVWLNIVRCTIGDGVYRLTTQQYGHSVDFCTDDVDVVLYPYAAVVAVNPDDAVVVVGLADHSGVPVASRYFSLKGRNLLELHDDRIVAMDCSRSPDDTENTDELVQRFAEQLDALPETDEEGPR